MDENQVLELVEFYEDMIEKQDEIIYRMTALLKSYVREIHNLRTIKDLTQGLLKK